MYARLIIGPENYQNGENTRMIMETATYLPISLPAPVGAWPSQFHPARHNLALTVIMAVAT